MSIFESSHLFQIAIHSFVNLFTMFDPLVVTPSENDVKPYDWILFIFKDKYLVERNETVVILKAKKFERK